MLFGEKPMGVKLKEFRLAHGLSLQDMANHSDFKKQYLSLIETERVTKLQPKTIKKLNDLFEYFEDEERKES